MPVKAVQSTYIAGISSSGPYKPDTDSFVSYSFGDWTHYHNYSEVVNTLLYLNATYPNVVQVFSIGKSWQNRTIYCIRLTNETDTSPKAEVLFVGYHHAREPISAELAFYFAVDAATKYGVNQTITHMLNESIIYIIVALNVDGFSLVRQNEWQRKNAHPFDEDGDGRLDEDPPEDEDGDGYIEDLYFFDGYSYEFIRWEGTDNDADGGFGEDLIGGVDLNRNYGYKWNVSGGSSPYPKDEDYRGPAPFSEPETCALRDLALQHNFVCAISFHSGTENILYPWGYARIPTQDDAMFRQIAQNLSLFTGAPNEQSASMYPTSGVWDDWMYGNRTAFALTCEIYGNYSAWRTEPGPEPNTWWESGIFQAFNPPPSGIEPVILRWLPVFTYITDRAIVAEPHDIAVTNVTPLKTIVGQGFLAHIDVTVRNRGEFAENFRVTVYASMINVTSREVTLASGATTTLTLAWNTTGFFKTTCQISAYVQAVAGEVHTSDNTLADGTVKITKKGDINGDGSVNVLDLIVAASALGTRPGNPKWNANADLNDDNVINVLDLILIAKYLGT